ncbi:MAG TPA: hypothetical protein PK784_06600 [Tenuifilaceae bacterium]|nr:hypothetical protein [Tenuifilaceae bacterium]HPN21640.1 hypothetical protein [Tenuifilaceae bacterium]
MIKRYLFLLAAILVFTSGFSQRDIEPKLIFSDTANFSFTGEWQYLSTDIFMFNGDKFSNLINELDFARVEPKAKRRKKTALEQENLEYLFITASLKNVKFFGDNDITYPLYNFQISKDKESKYQTFVSDNIDHVRIIDNLPLYSAKDYIDAEIRVRAITNNDKDQILSLVATQLKNLSKILTPTDAVMAIIGEFGNFIESNSKKKEYKFSSTIRLFEQKNFDTRVHSIKLYALSTANSNPIEIATEPFRSFLDTVQHGKVSRDALRQLLTYKHYPVIVVVNYKSLYRMDPVSGDEVTFANIEKRKLKYENDFRLGLINSETYRQEKDFTTFLTVFANFKNHLDVYNLNYRTGNTDAISGSLFRVMQYNRQLIKAFEEIKFKYKGNNTFTSIFNREYESVLGFASLYLDGDHNLKSTKDLVNTLIKLESVGNISVNELELYIAALQFSGIFKPELMNQNLEGQLINSQISRLENDLYRVSFEKEVQKLNETQATKQTKSASSALLALTKNTSCGLCRERAIMAINAFGQRMDEFNRKQELLSKDSIVLTLEPWIFKKLEQLQVIKGNFEAIYSNDSNLESTKYLNNKIAEVERDVNNVKDFMKVDVTSKDLSTIANLNQKLITYQKQIDETLKLVCDLKPELCSSGRVKTAENPEKLSAVFEKADQAVRQANIFIAIFDYQVKQISSKIDTSAPQSRKDKLESIQSYLGKLKTTVSLMENKDLTSDAYQKLDKEANQLINVISDSLVLME